MSNWTYTDATQHLTTATTLTSPRTHRPPAHESPKLVTPRVGPTVSLEARPIVVPILSCVFGFPVLALAIICALRYRAKRARKRSQMKRLQAASNTWRHQEEQLRGTYSVSDINERETSLSVPGRNSSGLLLDVALPASRAFMGRVGRPGSGRKATPIGTAEQNGKVLRVPRPRRDLDILAEHSEVDFEYTDVDVI